MPKTEQDAKPAPKKSDGWDNDGWNDDDGGEGGEGCEGCEGWDKFDDAPSSTTKIGSGASSSERKLTKMELAQLKKEEASKRRK